MKEQFRVDTPIMKVVVTIENDTITQVMIDASKVDYPIAHSDKAKQIEQAIRDYVTGKRPPMDFELVITGTPFQTKVYECLRHVPYGQTISYGELAKRAGYPKAARAVGSAMKHNQIALFIPCHRVIQSSGRLGYYGGGEALKASLLELEQNS